jgi:hypothetical protein
MSKLTKKLNKKIIKISNKESLNYLYSTDELIIKYQTYLLELNKIRQQEINHQISIGAFDK